MRIYLLTLLFAFAGMSLSAQIKTPQASPFSTLEQVVGMTDVTIEYSRPSVRDRVIFGDLVPYGETWRVGANANTKMTFSTDVTVGGQELKKGTYAVYAKPGVDAWEVYFYSDHTNWGKPKEWDDSKVSAKLTAKSTKLPISMESFLINVGNLNNNSAMIQFIWENTLASFELTVPTKSIVEKNIETVMAGPSSRDYYNAAGFYLDEKSNLDTALTYIDKSITMGYEKFWVVRRKALIQAELGDYKNAIKSAGKSMEMAEKAGNMGYVNSNKDSIDEWKKMR